MNILLLGCGDARGLLYTTWSNEDLYKELAFTVCDTDPAVLARNIVLLASLVQLNKKAKTLSKSVWNTYYHFYITRGDTTYLRAVLNKLLETSTNLEKWNSSSHGKVISFSNLNTLERVRTVWKQHLDVIDKEGNQAKDYEARKRSEIKKLWETRTKGMGVIGAFRAASPRCVESFDTIVAAFQGYWRTGVIGGNEADVKDLNSMGSAVNPMLSVSSAPDGKFAAHYGTDPLMSFHIAEIFDSNQESGYLEESIKIAKGQFGQWCLTWAKAARSGRVKVLVHCGDAIAFCHGLQNVENSQIPLFNSLWRSEQFVVAKDGAEGPPKKFDVIDTSNLVDSVGMLAVLPATVPLLETRPTSMLYTETLLQAALKTSDALQEMLCFEPTTIFAILGVAPVGYLTKVTSDMTGRDDLLMDILAQSGASSGFKQKQCLLRIPWKFPASGDLRAVKDDKFQFVPQVEPDGLANVFFGLYQKMFLHEKLDPSSMMRQIQNPLSGDLRFYTRASLAIFLAFVKERTRTDWGVCMKSLIEKVEADRSMLIGSNQIQELLLLAPPYRSLGP